jgi:hypothetical protein
MAKLALIVSKFEIEKAVGANDKWFRVQSDAGLRSTKRRIAHDEAMERANPSPPEPRGSPCNPA